MIFYHNQTCPCFTLHGCLKSSRQFEEDFNDADHNFHHHVSPNRWRGGATSVIFPVPNGWRVGSCPTPLTPMLNIRDKIPWPTWKLQNQRKHIKITYRVYNSWNLLILSRHPSILNRIHRYICKDRVKLIADTVH